MEEEFKGLISMFGDTSRTIKTTLNKIEKDRKISFCRWVSNMSLAYNKSPEEVLEVFKKSFKAINKVAKNG